MNAVYSAVAIVPLIVGNPAIDQTDRMQYFREPVDAVSAYMEDATEKGMVRGFDGKEWTSWQPLEVDPDQDPTSHESTLITFPVGMTQIQVRAGTNVELHPIRVSKAPVFYDIAATSGNFSVPSILTRSQWGADESLRIASAHPRPPEVQEAQTHQDNGNGDTATNNRVEECNAAVRDYPDEFRTAKTVRHIGSDPLLWPMQYSKKINMLVVHHTAQSVEGDARPGVERMRAIYQYHAVSKRWGDIGYNYVIDETGQIYEGRAGGDYVVSGHAYCNNVGTMGVALMGNFEEKEPTQAQVRSLQWLLKSLADKYDIDLDRSVMFHGKTRSPISVHGDLLSTSCPGFYLHGAMDQIRENVMNGTVDNVVKFPAKPRRIITTDKPFVDRSAERRARRQSEEILQVREGLYAITPVELSGSPGQEVLISLKYVAGTDGAKRGKAIGAITRSDDGIGVWLDRNGAYERLRSSLMLPEKLGTWEALTMQLKVSFPLKEGMTSLTIGNITYHLQASGRRMRVPMSRTPSSATNRTTLRREQVVRPVTSSSSRSFTSSRFSPPSTSSSVSSNNQKPVTNNSPLIRIRLSYPDNTLSAAVITGTMDQSVLKISGDECIQTQNGTEVARGKVVRIVEGYFKITSWQRLQNEFRGTLECRVMDHKIVLINELSLEDYLKGLAEEPDTEPIEKQKAFAVAARSYALHYLGDKYRKFPGMPYDGTDNAANFQKYVGKAFERDNARWIKVVEETAGEVLTKNGDVIRAPYFHSDNGSTRSPLDLGWLSFPHADVYASKPDPWCKGQQNAGHGVGMSGCGAKGQALEGKTYKEILEYYYPGTVLEKR